MPLQYPPPFKNFPHMIHGGDYNPDQWLHAPEILQEDMRLMRLANMNSATVGIFAWHALEPEENVYRFDWLDETMERLHQNGMRVILSTPSGARPAWLDKKYPEALRTSPNRVQNLHGGRHNHCYTSPIYREKVRNINARLAERYGGHPALAMWHISNEYGGECHCPLCQEAFRDWLRAKYGVIDRLNAAWWAAFWSHSFNDFSQIESPAPHGELRLHGLTLDWRRFVTDQTIDFMRAEIAPLRKLSPGIPVTTNLMSLFTKLNYHKLAQHIDIVSWDDYPTWHNDEEPMAATAQRDAFNHDWFRSLRGGQPFMLMECTPSCVNWAPVNKLKRPSVLALGAVHAIAHGADSIQYFQWRKSRGSSEKLHGAVVDHCGHEHTRVFREVSGLGALLKTMDGVVGSSIPAQAAVIWDVENEWAIESLQGASNQRNYVQTCIAHHAPFWKQGVPVDVIDSTAPYDAYRLLAAPMLYMIRPGVAQRLREFVRNGGTLVLTYFSGYVDENDLCHLGGFPGDGLQELAGVWVEELDSLYPTDENHLLPSLGNSLNLNGRFGVHSFCEVIHPKEGCETLAVYGEDYYQGQAALTRNAYGKGSCYYIAARTDDDFLGNFYCALFNSTGLMPASPNLPLGVHAMYRQSGEERHTFYLNFTDKQQKVGELELQPYGILHVRDK